jgi:hypothetical protein
MLGIRGAYRAFCALVIAIFATAGLALVAPVAAHATPLPPTNYSDYAVYGDHGVFIGAGSTVNGLVGARHNWPATNAPALGMNGGSSIGTPPTVIADARVGEDINVANGVTITGTPYYVGTFHSGNPFTSGNPPTQVSLSDLNLPPAPIPSAWPAPGTATYCGTGADHGPDISVPNSHLIQLDRSAGGIYGDIHGGGGTTLEFKDAGDYFLDSLSMGNSSHYKIDNPNVRLFICTFSHVGSANMSPAGLTPSQFYIEVGAIGLTTVADLHNAWRQGGGNMVATVVVPNGGIHFGTGSCCTSLNGQLIGDTVDIEHGTTISPPATHPHAKTGLKFEDANANDGDYNPAAGDTLLPGWIIHVYQSGTTNDVVGSPFTTDITGQWGPANLENGVYDICEENPAGSSMHQTYPNATTPSPNPGIETVISTCPAPNVWGYQLTITDQAPGTISGDDFGNAPTAFCSKQPVNDVLSINGQYPNNKGPDIVVHVDKGEKVQDFIDFASDPANVADINGDGYIIVAVSAKPGSALGGDSTQNVNIDAPFNLPFALIGCSVTLHDAIKGDGIPTINIGPNASAPGGIFLMDLHGADSDTAAIQVAGEASGNSRTLRNEYAKNSAVGFLVNGNNITIHNGAATGNKGDGANVTGNNNVIDSTDAISNGGDGFDVTGNNNTIDSVDSGEKNTPNGGVGVRVTGNGNTVTGADAYNNAGGGVSVTGNNNTLSKNVAGDKGKGNGLNGFTVAGSGNTLSENVASTNGAIGFAISGGTVVSPNSIKKNVSNPGAPGSATENAGAEWSILDVVFNNGGGNKADNIEVPRTTAPAKCTTFDAKNATANFAPSANICE